MPPTSVHFNGSVNLQDAEAVMREISARIPRGVRRMTDGETGERNYWIVFQVRKFADMPEFEPAGSWDPGGDDMPALPQLRLAEGVAAHDVRWPDLAYAAAYADSFERFRALRDAGTIPADVRLQLQYPTPLAPIAGTVAPEHQADVAASYERALFDDLRSALARLPHDQIAVQWDVAVEFAMLEGGFGFAAVELDEIVPALVRCVDEVPDDVPVGLHLCYGDAGHRHFKQPESLAMQVRLANAVSAAARRPVGWFSLTVPQDQRDAAFFAPLADLATGRETELSFGIVPYHPDDQPPGTTAEQVRLIDDHLGRSSAGTRGWAVSTECGMGRAGPEEVPGLLDLHREILAAG